MLKALGETLGIIFLSDVLNVGMCQISKLQYF